MTIIITVGLITNNHMHTHIDCAYIFCAVTGSISRIARKHTPKLKCETNALEIVFSDMLGTSRQANRVFPPCAHIFIFLFFYNIWHIGNESL